MIVFLSVKFLHVKLPVSEIFYNFFLKNLIPHSFSLCRQGQSAGGSLEFSELLSITKTRV